jgi:hypothetical protein
MWRKFENDVNGYEEGGRGSLGSVLRVELAVTLQNGEAEFHFFEIRRRS